MNLRTYFLSLGLLMGVNSFAQENNQGVETAPVVDPGIIVTSSNSSAFDVYKLLAKEADENLVFSPFSLTTAMGMVYSGADGSTQTQMARLLRLPLKAESLGSSFGLLTEKLNRNQKKIGDTFFLNISNGLWIQKEQTLLPDFQNSIVKDYRGTIKQVDFETQSDAITSEINNWIKERTQGKIPTLFNRSDIIPDTKILLVSTIYMRAKWLHPFDSSLTRQTPFFPHPSKSMTVSMMAKTERFPYFKGSDFTLVELPYNMHGIGEDVNAAMLILLPDETFGLSEIESRLDAGEMQKWIKQLEMHKVSVSLPKFKIVSSLGFVDVYAKMGMVLPFSDKADFSRIDGTEDLKISKIIQKSYILVDEKGTEAAAATGVIMATTAYDPEIPKIFNADHPFMYLIIDKLSGVILFMGRVSNPED